MNTTTTRSIVEHLWETSIIPALTEYIRIPNESPLFDPEWAQHGHMDKAVELARAWVEGLGLAGASVDVLRLPGRTPLLLIEVEGTTPGTVMLYGHLDKQPPFDGWLTEEGLGPWTPVRRGDRLYGRGGADDGYAVFAIGAAVQSLQRQGAPTPRLVALIECSEESGSPDLPAYIDAAADRIGTPDLVICLDSGCGDYERLWMTTSLRGLVVGTLRVDVLTEGFHSGDASGIVPSSFRVLRRVLDRLEDPDSGELLVPALRTEIPPVRVEQADEAARVLGHVEAKYPFVEGMRAMSDDPATLILNRTWRPTLSVVGVDGVPPVGKAGSVLRPYTALKLSIRIPPGVDPAAGAEAVREVLEADPPYGARVRFHPEDGAWGWHAPVTAEWLDTSIREASEAFFGKEPAAVGEGGSIPFMAMLGQRFPQAQFLITGVLGPKSNAHGPNEFLHLPMAKALSACVAHVIADMGDMRTE
ncbi:MAG: peptidase M20 [Myxococcales bacterium]